MKIYIATVESDRSRNEVIRFIKLCKKKDISVEISKSILPEKEVSCIRRSDIVILILSNISIYSTWLLALIKLIKKNKGMKLYFTKIDDVNLPFGFENNLDLFTEVRLSKLILQW